MNENWLPPGGLCADYFVTATMLREPIARVLSQWDHMLDVLVTFGVAQATSTNLRTYGDLWSEDARERLRIAPAVGDNLLTRTLLGQRGFALPLGGIGEEHYVQARKVLLRFDVLLILEEFCPAGLQAGLRGWRQAPMKLPHARKAQQQSSRPNRPGHDALIGLLRSLNHWDSMLYAEAPPSAHGTAKYGSPFCVHVLGTPAITASTS
eukprot:CAMPEP_0183380344 /NCGR_PEP_ID=MMETSP0164_2-20130417/125887_1 /TAXON_ID=221442 /ORGANISM="Coccolithus pelagicus ssp braarudi, Strain PLY182g" /LENGTH=207 /DNA_ID=CAMNT_0025557941 /DNA_START=995 /DNA_END=1619 /DNA_ORIENTATION=-